MLKGLNREIVITMEIRRLNMQDLLDLIHSDEVKKWSALPISRLRLLSQSRNPFIRPDDIVMIIQVDNNDLAGYMGAVPDELNGQYNGKHVAWASCIWIDPRQRGKGLGKRLTEELYNAWNGRLFLAEFTPTAQSIYHSMGSFQTFTKKKGYRFFFRSIFHSLAIQRNKKPFLRPFLRMADIVVNSIQSIRIQLFSLLNKKQGDRFGKTDPKNNSAWQKSESVFRQDAAKWSWLSTQPWLSHDPVAEEKKYFFATHVQRYELGAGEIEGVNGKPVGHIIYTIFNNDMRVIDAGFTGTRRDERIFVKAVTCFICSNHIHTVLSYSKIFNDLLLTHPMVYFFKKKRVREYLVGNPLMDNNKFPSNPVVEEYDGDVFFT